MNNHEIFPVELEPVKMTPHLKKHFKAISRWAFFMAFFGILGLGCSLFFTVMIAIRAINNPYDGNIRIVALIISLVLSTVTFFAMFFHLRFAIKMQHALKWDNQDAFDSAWSNFLNFFRFLGIWLIIMLMLTASFLSSIT